MCFARFSSRPRAAPMKRRQDLPRPLPDTVSRGADRRTRLTAWGRWRSRQKCRAACGRPTLGFGCDARLRTVCVSARALASGVGPHTKTPVSERPEALGPRDTAPKGHRSGGPRTRGSQPCRLLQSAHGHVAPPGSPCALGGQEGSPPPSRNTSANRGCQHPGRGTPHCRALGADARIAGKRHRPRAWGRWDRWEVQPAHTEATRALASPVRKAPG